jgi:Ribophorin I
VHRYEDIGTIHSRTIVDNEVIPILYSILLNLHATYLFISLYVFRYTYLDTVMNGGRPVLKLKASNLVAQHDKQIVISYSFSRSRMLVEPLILIASVFAAFLVCSVIARLDDKVSKGSVSKQ